MAGSIAGTPTFALQPSAEQVALATNYITTFNFSNQYLPDTFEKEFARYGNRTLSNFLHMVGAELPSNSDQIIWAEQGRLHVKYTNVTTTAGTYTTGAATFTVADTGAATCAYRVGQTVLFSNNAGTQTQFRGLITSVSGLTFQVYFYEASVTIAASQVFTTFVYGSEFAKGQYGMSGSLEAEDSIFTNKPIILKDKYAVNGSDMTQIGWVEINTEDGATGYLWYLKSQHETRLRFEDYMEMALLESVPAVAGGGVATQTANTTLGKTGTEGVFYTVGNRGNVWAGGTPTALTDWDSIVARLDKQGAIEENALFLNRDFSFDIDDMLATLNGYNGGSSSGGASFGLFDNDVEMALNLGFTGFRRGYDFYKSDWKYLNDATARGGLSTGSTMGTISGLLVPAGSTNVYDQIMGENARRPFLHVRYRQTQAEDRRYKSWITGSAGGAQTNDLDAMEVQFLSERCVCTLGANNFFLFKY